VQVYGTVSISSRRLTDLQLAVNIQSPIAEARLDHGLAAPPQSSMPRPEGMSVAGRGVKS